MVLANVQSNAVSQFEAWSNEEKSFHRAAANADRERSRGEERLQQLREQQKALSHAMREASDALGLFHREGVLLKQQKEQNQKQLQEERVMLEQCAAETEQLVTQDETNKKEFCKEMEALNEELSDLLMQQEDFRLQKMVSIESVQALRDAIEQQPTASPESNNDSVIAELEGAMELFKAAAVKHEAGVKERQAVEASVEALRARVLQQRGQVRYCQ